MDKDLYRETGTLFKRSPLVSPTGEGFAAKVRAVVADHARQLQGMMSQAKQAKGRFTQGMAGKKRTMLPGGVLVETWINPNGLVPTICARVTYPKPVKIIEVEIDLLSGFFYTSNPVFPVLDGVYSRISTRNYKTNTYGPWQSSAQMASLFNYGIAESFYYKKAPMYSGKMREVVQLLIGVDATVADGKAGYIPYEYFWSECHGIFVNKETGGWWVIWIDIDNGVSAWPLAFDRLFSDEEKDFLGITIPGVPASLPIYPRGSTTGFREIMAQEDLYVAFEDGSPLYADHGWAFSYDGSEAQAITVTFSAEWKVANRWKLSIQADENGDPVAATLQLQEQKCLYGPKTAAPKYPQRASGSLLPFAINYEVVTERPFDTDAPVDVFYRADFSNTPIIVRHEVYGSTVDEEYGTVTWPPASDAYVCNIEIPTDMGSGGTYCGGVGNIVRTTQVHYSVEGAESPLLPEQTYTDTRPSVYTLAWTQDGGWNRVSKSGGGMYIAETHHKAELKRRYSDVEQNIYANAFFKPFQDREVFCLYEQQLTTYATGPQDTVTTGGATGELYTQGVENYSGYFLVCGAGMATYAQPPVPTCSGSYPSINLGSKILVGAVSGATQVSSPVISPDRYSSVCEAGGNPTQYQVWCDIPGAITYPGPGCAFSSTTDGSTATTRARQCVWVYNPVLKRFAKTWESDEYDPFEPYTIYIDNPLWGAQMFITYFDVFSGQGMSYAEMNSGSTSDLYHQGTLFANYDTGDTPGLGLNSGWFGVP